MTFAGSGRSWVILVSFLLDLCAPPRFRVFHRFAELVRSWSPVRSRAVRIPRSEHRFPSACTALWLSPFGFSTGFAFNCLAFDSVAESWCSARDFVPCVSSWSGNPARRFGPPAKPSSFHFSFSSPASTRWGNQFPLMVFRFTADGSRSRSSPVRPRARSVLDSVRQCVFPPPLSFCSSLCLSALLLRSAPGRFCF
jgi:hypothetical protein